MFVPLSGNSQRSLLYVYAIPDFPGGAAALAVTVECNDVVFPSSVVAPGFEMGHAVVTVTGLTPGTQYSLRCRCEVADAEVDPDTLWSPPVPVVTLDLAGLEVRRYVSLAFRTITGFSGVHRFPGHLVRRRMPKRQTR